MQWYEYPIQFVIRIVIIVTSQKEKLMIVLYFIIINIYIINYYLINLSEFNLRNTFVHLNIIDHFNFVLVKQSNKLMFKFHNNWQLAMLLKNFNFFIFNLQVIIIQFIMIFFCLLLYRQACGWNYEKLFAGHLSCKATRRKIIAGYNWLAIQVRTELHCLI